MTVETCFEIAFLVGLAVGIVLVVHGTIAKNGWGVMAPVRMPNSREQASWGGYTCPSCKCELDKWGRQISRPV